MKKKLLTLVLLSSLSFSAKAGVGISTGLGAPFVSQYGLNATLNPNWSVGLGYNALDLSLGTASLSLTMPEVVVNWHPFSGSFFLGLGLGQESLSVKGEDSTTGLEASTDVTAMTTIVKLGWMWGIGDGGFWGGMDVAYISPSGADVEVDSGGLPQSSDEVQDVIDAAEAFGETAYVNITFLRLGYLF